MIEIIEKRALILLFEIQNSGGGKRETNIG